METRHELILDIFETIGHRFEFLAELLSCPLLFLFTDSLVMLSVFALLAL